MPSYKESLPKIRTTSFSDEKQSETNLKELRERFQECNYIAICNDFYIDDNSPFLSDIVKSIDSKILHAQKLIELKSEIPLKESERIGIAFLYLWSTLNDIFYLRFNLNRDEWLMMDPNKKILKLGYKDGDLFSLMEFNSDPSNIHTINYAKRSFSRELKKLNPDYKGERGTKPNEIFFLGHLIGIYFNELNPIFNDCKDKRNYHELIHGTTRGKNNKSDFNFNDINYIVNIIKVLLFLD